MQIRTSEAVVLRHLDYGEADRIVTLYVREVGLIKGFARNARSSRKRFGPALEPFARITLHWQLARGEGMARLREAELQDLRPGLRSRLDSLALGAYGCELLEALFGDGEPHPEVFDLFNAFLGALSENSATELSGLKLLLELRLLRAAGYLPHLLHCSECGATAKDAPVTFSAARGGRLCLRCGGSDARLRISPLTLGTLARCLKTPHDLFAGFHFGGTTLAEGDAVLREALQEILSHPLRSQTFLDRLPVFRKPPESR